MKKQEIACTGMIVAALLVATPTWARGKDVFHQPNVRHLTSSCAPFASDAERTASEVASGVEYQCSTLLVVVDGPGQASPTLSADDPAFIACGWREDSTPNGGGTHFTVYQTDGTSNFQINAVAGGPGAKVYTVVKVRWYKVISERNEVPAPIKCDQNGFRLPKPISNPAGASGPIAPPNRRCHWVNDGVHPPFLECAPGIP